MKQERKERHITTLAALVLLLIFSLGVLSALLGGAGIYKRLHQQGQEWENIRNAVMLVTNKLRQRQAAVTVEAFGQGDALLLWEQSEQGEYLTRIYCYDGWLRELFTSAEGSFAPEDGEKLLPMVTMELKLADGFLTVVFSDDHGSTKQFVLAVEEVRP